LRFDRVAVGLVRRLKTALSASVPDGRTVVVTITAPIRQDSSTAAVLENRVRELLAAGKSGLKTTIHANRVEVRVLPGRASRGSALIGFVHSPGPGAALLFEVTRCLLALMDSRQRTPAADCHWLSRDGTAPLDTIEHVCSALRARKLLRHFRPTRGRRASQAADRRRR
jgi:hypothetical protein